MNTDEVVDQYRKGDLDRRLGLFLSYRGLREEFERLEQQEPSRP